MLGFWLETLESACSFNSKLYNNIIINIDKINKEERCQLKWKVRLYFNIQFHGFTIIIYLVEYWRTRKQRMNKERFVAANAMALITHTLV